MKLLDAFCGQGGASAGYTTAGFEVTGVDIVHQTHYYPGARFVQADALTYLAEHGHEYDAIHASPPCQAYSQCQRIRRNQHPDLVGPTRELLVRIGKPWVIENVLNAPLINPIELCGCMFEGIHTYRERLFETGGGFGLDQPAHRAHVGVTVKMGRPLKPGDWYYAIGNFGSIPYVRADMGVPWMNRDGIRECVPPIYADFIGSKLIKEIGDAQES